MGYRLGVAVGGTFTDLLLLEEGTGTFWRHKTLSTPHDSSEEILTGVEAACAKTGISAGDVEIFLHGMTVATNAVLEGKGARVGLIVGGTSTDVALIENLDARRVRTTEVGHFGDTGPLHLKAVARLMESWPAVSPGALCGSATAIQATRSCAIMICGWKTG